MRGSLLDVLNQVSSLKRCQDCGMPKGRGKRRRGPGAPEIAAKDGVAYWRGVQRCGSIHACAVCGAKIRRGRALEISEAAAAWIDRGNEVYMVTLTAPHDLGMALAALLLLIANAFRSVIAGRAWLRLKDELGIAGTIRSLEVTHGGLNGWHPHLHVLVFVRGTLDAPGLLKFYRYFKGYQYRGDVPGQWGRFIHSVCRHCGKKKARGARASDPCTCGGPVYAAPSYEHGVRIERCYSGKGAAEYICKTEETKRSPGNELARGDMKSARSGHRVPFEILASAGAGDEADMALWLEYEQATFRRQAITWSKGLREIVRGEVPERAVDEDWLAEVTDEDLAAAEVDGAAVARVAPEVLTAGPGGFRVSVLEAYEDRGLEGLEEFVMAAGLGWAWEPGSPVPVIVPADP